MIRLTFHVAPSLDELREKPMWLLTPEEIDRLDPIEQRYVIGFLATPPRQSRWPYDPPRVWNRRNPCAPADAVNIMRGTPHGNRFKIGALWPERNVLMTRDDVCDRFEAEVLPTLDVSRLRGRDLLCCCKPKRCHGDAILRKANA